MGNEYVAHTSLVVAWDAKQAGSDTQGMTLGVKKKSG